MKEMKRNGMKVFGNALKVTLGAGAALGSTYLLCRIKDKQESETSLSRLEKMLEELLGSGADNTSAKDTRK
ncbi:MAG: hypothetical protein A2X80_09855 [Geobacteraceae bacterium GWB2_52_12]|nr:MAG: hypothetical protein A2X80_09855 [Geobacteraceae bacterium GWB2_52_12]